MTEEYALEDSPVTPRATGTTEGYLCTAISRSVAQDAPRICNRPAEWYATGRNHAGQPVTTKYACFDTMHRGQAAAAAWQEYNVVKVEVRQIGRER